MPCMHRLLGMYWCVHVADPVLPPCKTEPHQLLLPAHCPFSVITCKAAPTTADGDVPTDSTSTPADTMVKATSRVDNPAGVTAAPPQVSETAPAPATAAPAPAGNGASAHSMSLMAGAGALLLAALLL